MHILYCYTGFPKIILQTRGGARGGYFLKKGFEWMSESQGFVIVVFF